MRLIDIDELNKKLDEIAREPNYQHEGEDWSVGVLIAQSTMNDFPVITPESLVKRGRWKTDWFGEGLHSCSECGKVFDLSVNGEDFKFCPYCGCKMVED